MSGSARFYQWLYAALGDKIPHPDLVIGFEIVGSPKDRLTITVATVADPDAMICTAFSAPESPLHGAAVEVTTPPKKQPQRETNVL